MISRPERPGRQRQKDRKRAAGAKLFSDLWANKWNGFWATQGPTEGRMEGVKCALCSCRLVKRWREAVMWCDVMRHLLNSSWKWLRRLQPPPEDKRSESHSFSFLKNGKISKGRIKDRKETVLVNVSWQQFSTLNRHKKNTSEAFVTKTLQWQIACARVHSLLPILHLEKMVEISAWRALWWHWGKCPQADGGEVAAFLCSILMGLV